MRTRTLFLTLLTAISILLITNSSAFSQTFTGCLKPNGKLIRVNIGTEPSRPCGFGSEQITWNTEGPHTVFVDSNDNLVGEIISEDTRCPDIINSPVIKLNLTNQNIVVCVTHNVLSSDTQPTVNVFGGPSFHFATNSNYSGSSFGTGFDGPDCTGNAYWKVHPDPALIPSFLGFAIRDYVAVVTRKDLATGIWENPKLYIAFSNTPINYMEQSVWTSDGECITQVGEVIGLPLEVLIDDLFNAFPLPYKIVKP
jgi:hypothetical protein